MKKGGIVNKKGGIVSKEGEIRAETRIMWSAREDVRARRESGCGRWFNVGDVGTERRFSVVGVVGRERECRQWISVDVWVPGCGGWFN